MTHVVTQSCCSDASCVYACPVNCIQPTPDSPGFIEAEMLHIDPVACVDCGACVAACPVDAIKPQTQLTEAELPFLKINRDYHRPAAPRPLLAPVTPALEVRRHRRPLKVAVVGSGPAGMYAADEVLTVPGARVVIFERLPQPYGLARYGVAPDHHRTRAVARQFDGIRRHARLRLHTGVEVGHHVTRERLLADHDAVIYAVGASSDRRLEVPGIELPGTASATEFVAWYNGHPDQAGRSFDLDTDRAVVIGNGNVALDVARILALDPDRLADTTIAPEPLGVLRRSRIEEVVVVGRRGPAHAAFTLPELVGLSQTPGVELCVDSGALSGERHPSAKLEVLRSLSPRPDARRRIVLRFGFAPSRVTGADRASGVEFTAERGVTETIGAGLVLTSIGYRGRPVRDLPFDPGTGTVPNDRGRVRGEPRTYVAGWVKRGPSGFIGTNRSCSQETVRSLIEDFNAGWPSPAQTARPARLAHAA